MSHFIAVLIGLPLWVAILWEASILLNKPMPWIPLALGAVAGYAIQTAILRWRRGPR